MSLINREPLYEKACDLEAQALAYVGKIVNDETKIEEWKIWSAILTERTAFKHDIFDAPEVKLEQKWIPVTERLPSLRDEIYLVSLAWGCIGTMEFKDTGWHNSGSLSPVPIETVTAWMPVPEPYVKNE